MRRALMLALFLVLGAIVNVAVAWLCVVCRGTVEWEYRHYHNPSRSSPLVIVTVERFGYTIVRGVERSGTLLDRYPQIVHHYHGTAWWNDDALQILENNYAIACGWPLLALTSWRTMSNDDEERFPGIIHGGVLWDSIIPNRAQHGSTEIVPSILAFKPLWPGFAINTVFYAVVLWLLFAAPFALRRRRRIKRGLCAKCAYPVGTNAVCTECGATIRSRPERGAGM